MNKFWNIKTTENSPSEIYIFGDITGEKWSDSDTTAKTFSDDLKACNGNPVTVHINSGGGDVFHAIAIYNVLKNYKGNVTISIDGLAASAASIVSCAGDKVCMARNALMMIHDVSVNLFGYYDESDVKKLENSLAAVKKSIVQTYKAKTGMDEAKLVAMMKKETWLTAEEALENNFVDEITEPNAEFANFLNYLNNSTKERNAVDEKNFIEKIVNAVTKKLKGDAENDEVKSAADLEISAARDKEISRIRELNTKKQGNPAADAILDIAIKDGLTFANVEKYFNAVMKNSSKEFNFDANKAAEYIAAVIEDNLKSGASGVDGSTPPPSEEDKRRHAADNLAKFANQIVK